MDGAGLRVAACTDDASTRLAGDIDSLEFAGGTHAACLGSHFAASPQATGPGRAGVGDTGDADSAKFTGGGVEFVALRFGDEQARSGARTAGAALVTVDGRRVANGGIFLVLAANCAALAGGEIVEAVAVASAACADSRADLSRHSAVGPVSTIVTTCGGAGSGCLKGTQAVVREAAGTGHTTRNAADIGFARGRSTSKLCAGGRRQDIAISVGKATGLC